MLPISGLVAVRAKRGTGRGRYRAAGAAGLEVPVGIARSLRRLHGPRCRLEVAASQSEQAAKPPTRDEFAAWLQTVPGKEKDALLVDAALDANLQTGAEVLRRFELSRGVRPDSKEQPNRRTVGELLAAAEERSAKKVRQIEERGAVEQARKDREVAKARDLYLDQLAEREEATWKEVTALIQTKKPGKYDLAIGLLRDLRDLAARGDEDAAFHSAVKQLREVHASKPSLLRRITEAGL